MKIRSIFVLLTGAAIAAACGGSDGAVPAADITAADGGGSSSSGATSSSSGGSSSSSGGGSSSSSGGSSSGGSSSGGTNDGGVDAGPPVVFASTLAAGGSSACVIEAGGVLKCWGAGKETSTVVGAGSTWSEVDVSTFQTCAIKSDQTLWCWQSATFNPLVRDTGSFKKVSIGDAHGCAINDANKLYCWGANTVGQLGTGNTTAQANLTAVAAAKNWSLVSAADNHTCAIDDAGALYCWGYNAAGQVGDGGGSSVDAGVAQQHLPVPIMAGTTWLDVSAGYSSTCGVASDRRLRCWGTQWTQNGKVPTPIDTATDWATVRLASTHACAVKTTGAMYCWGQNGYGQLGNGAVSQSATTLTQVGTDTDWAAVDVGVYFTCGKKKNGGVYCWGANGNGELGIGMTNHTMPKKVTAAAEWKWVDATENTTCAVKKTGELYCWGAANYLAGPDLRRQVPHQIGTATDWATVDVGTSHACARKTNNAVHCWGYNGDGALGLGAVSIAATPTSVNLNAIAVSAGYEHTCAIEAGTSFLWCWGENIYDQGFSTESDSNVPRRAMGGDLTWTKVSAGYRSSCAIRTNGELYCAGLGYGNAGTGGELHFASATDVSAPPSSDTNRGIAGGKIKTWSYSSTPADDGAETSWKSVSAGYSHRCAIRNDNTLACGGTNTYGQVGDGTKDARVALTNVGTANDWEQVAVGRSHTCGIRNAGELHCWGDNQIGQIGDGTAWSTTPMPVQ